MTGSRESSSFTAAVIAMGRSFHACRKIRVEQDAAATARRSGSCRGVPSARATGASSTAGVLHPRTPRARGRPRRPRRPAPRPGRAPARVGQNLQVTLRGEARRSPRLRRQVEGEHPPRLRLGQGAAAPAPAGAAARRRTRSRGRAPPSRPPGPRRPPPGTAAGAVGHELHGPHLAGGERHGDLADHLVDVLGAAGSCPLTSAWISSGTADIGSTRPWAPSSRPTRSRAATGSPSCSHRPTSSRLPTACPASSPLPLKRCWMTRAQVRPQSSSPASAASAMRRSPGGSTPSSSRSRPLEPPSSATVTTAVRSPVTRRSAERGGQALPAAQRDHLGLGAAPAAAAGAGRAPGPRRRRTRSPGHSRPMSRWTTTVSTPVGGEPGGELLGHGHGAVLAAGAAHREGHVPLALPPVAGGDQPSSSW